MEATKNYNIINEGKTLVGHILSPSKNGRVNISSAKNLRIFMYNT